MSRTSNPWTKAAVVPVLCLLGLACEPAPSPSTRAEPQALEERVYELRLEGARRMAGSDTIARRPASYGLDAKELVRLGFAEHDTEWARSMLLRGGKAMFGARVEKAEVVVDDRMVSMRLDGAVAWVDIRSGAFTFKRLGHARGITRVADAREAVDRSLDQLAKLDLVGLAEGVTLDVVGVKSTHYAAWYEDKRALRPVNFMDPSLGEETVTRFKSEYTVYFGRRYKGVPIVGPALMVRLDAEGKIAAVAKPWRDIDRIGPKTDAVVEPDEPPRFAYQTCGYLEGPAISYRQQWPGIGCVFYTEVEGAGDPLASMRSTRVSFSEDPDLDPLGKPTY